MKNVLITGGSRGIGRACVEKFAREGHTVSFIYNNSILAANELADKTGAYAIKADISNPSEARSAVAAAIDRMGGVDILINNAGISLIKLFTDTTDEEYYNIMPWLRKCPAPSTSSTRPLPPASPALPATLPPAMPISRKPRQPA